MGLRNLLRKNTLAQRTIAHSRAMYARRKSAIGEPPPAPRRVIIEPTNACNLACSYCGNSKMSRKLRNLPMELYEKMIGEMVEHGIERLTLHTIGEPTLHPRICDMISIAKDAGRFVNISTNGSRLTQELVEGLIDAGPDVLNVSVDAATDQALAKTRVGLKRKDLMTGLERLRARRDSHGRMHETRCGVLRLPTLVITCVVTPHFDRTEERAFFEAYSPFVDDFYFHFPNNHGNFVLDHKLGKRGWLPEGLRNRLYKAVRHPCVYPWDALFLLSDGSMSVCRFDFDANIKIGQYGEESLMELWQGDAMNELRRAHLAFDFKQLPTCENCDATWYENRHEHFEYTKLLKSRNNFRAARDAWEGPGVVAVAGTPLELESVPKA